MYVKIIAKCEKCRSILSNQSSASICSFECTFCPECTGELNGDCPNCDGELVPRPKRPVSPPVAGNRLITRKLLSLRSNT
ncbi:MAG: DUF1272 domain-containing protein [Xanthomonadaceae bacterium]|nr:DUF1272 domain-containing protein [Xanthomonadaceae bacterium]